MTNSMTLATKTREVGSSPRIVSFPSGSLYVTPGVIARLSVGDVMDALERHLVGDWGDLTEQDWRENEYAVDKDLRLFSAYQTEDGTRFWIITEADRSATTVLLPDEY
jgi:hypothetical protein